MYLLLLAQSPSAPLASPRVLFSIATFVISNPSSPASRSIAIAPGVADFVTRREQVMNGGAVTSSAGATTTPFSSTFSCEEESSRSETWNVSLRLCWRGGGGRCANGMVRRSQHSSCN